LYLDTRTRQEGLDLQYRVLRAFPALDRQRTAVGLALLVAFFLGGAARAGESSLDAVRAVRAGIEQVRQEVAEAEPYPGSAKWEGRVNELGRRLERSGDGEARRFRWYTEATEGFGKRGQSAALAVLDDLRDRLEVLEESLTRPRAEPPGRDRRTAPSQAEVKRMLRGGDDTSDDASQDDKAEEQPRKRQREEVQQDEPEGGKVGRRGAGLVAAQAVGGFGTFAWMLLFGLLLVVLVVGGVLFFSSRRSRPKTPPAPKGEVAVDALPQPQERSVTEWWRQAEELARAGQYLEAVRAVYLAVLSLLHRQQLLRYEPTRTNGEYVRMVTLAPQAPPSVVRPFEELTNRFELKWYGERSCEAGDFQACRALGEEIQRAART
jgi:hypothetical protein